MNLFAGALTHVAYCWRLERRDGAGLALTSHDRSLRIDGIDYAPEPGLAPKAMRFTGGLDPDDFEIAGGISSEGLSANELAVGKWDGARVHFFAVDWTDPEGLRHQFFAGELGEVSSGNGHYAAAVRGIAARLDVPAAPETSPLCRARLGDRACRVDLAGRNERCSVVSENGAALTIAPALGDSFLFGRLRVVDGPMRGFSSPVLAISEGVVTLRDVPSSAIGIGATVLVGEGCDKRFATCRDRFQNALNFRGEPHLPGTDLLTRYPGG